MEDSKAESSKVVAPRELDSELKRGRENFSGKDRAERFSSLAPSSDGQRTNESSFRRPRKLLGACKLIIKH